MSKRFLFVSLGILALSVAAPSLVLADFMVTQLPAFLPFEPCGYGGWVDQWRGHITSQTSWTLVLSAGNGIYLYDGVSRQIVFSWDEPSGQVWRVAIEDIDKDGLEEVIVVTRWSNSCALRESFIIEWTGDPLGTSGDFQGGGGGTRFQLEKNRPNPSNPATAIDFSLDGEADVTLTVFDTSGRRVRELLSERLRAGTHTATWDGADSNGHRVASGTYFYQLSVNGVAEARKMIVLR